jgi:hypothetical protein
LQPVRKVTDFVPATSVIISLSRARPRQYPFHPRPSSTLQTWFPPVCPGEIITILGCPLPPLTIAFDQWKYKDDVIAVQGRSTLLPFGLTDIATIELKATHVPGQAGPVARRRPRSPVGTGTSARAILNQDYSVN